ncbi:hypothetical protein J4447_00545 [Candidatus Pacearchaeota archaeon]|nr:hypothetical protein [Candidatus Pacearchaeota archaeon]
MTNPEIYNHTNENLEFAMKVIRPRIDDRILAVCGSGDHAFAMVENAGRVVAVDNLASLDKSFSLRKLRSDDRDDCWKPIVLRRVERKCRRPPHD